MLSPQSRGARADSSAAARYIAGTMVIGIRNGPSGPGSPPPRRRVLALALLGLALHPAGGSARADETLDRLESVMARIDGLWVGRKMRLEIAGKELRARRDDGNWEALQVLNIIGNMIMFTLGPDVIVALVRDKALEVTVRGLDGSQTLSRPGQPPGDAPSPPKPR